MGFQRRFDKAYRQAKELIDTGALGRIEAIRDTMRDPSPAPRAYLETSGGLYRDMTIHNFDCVRWMMGQEVRELFAMGSALVSPMFQELGDIDTSVISLRFGDDSLGVIDNSRRSGFGYDVRTEVFGSEGALMIGYSRDTPMLRLDANGIHSDHIYWFLERFDQAYIDELKVFVDGIVDGTRPPVDGQDARAAMALAYAAEASLRENAPVSPSRFART
jgi:myo-inositol 2-dehydrogenase/D-chiro-inositol 1-dehydrogenase